MRPSLKIALIVEAEGTQAVAFKIAARTQDLDPVWFRDNGAAIEHLSEHAAPRLLLLGLTSADGEELAVLRALRTRGTVLDTPAIVCSSVPELRERAWAHRGELGISQLIARPAKIEAVQDAIQSALANTGPLPAFVTSSEKPIQRTCRLKPILSSQALEEVAREVAQAFSADAAFVLIEGRPDDWVHVGALPLNPSVLSRWPPLRHVIDSRSPLIAIDAGDDLFAGDPIAERLDLQSFAAVPLVTSSGHAIGVLGIIDTGQLALTFEDLDSLVGFGRRLTGELELMEAFDDATRTADRLASSLSQVQSIVDHLDDGVLLLD